MCNAAAINDYHNIKDIETDEPKVQNCKIFYYESIIFYLATREIKKGEELWTDYGESYDLKEFTRNKLSLSSSS